jgi:glycosyltransferase involved in cell wall biosynthesis
MQALAHQYPSVSIITVNYNDGANLLKTITSVSTQDYPNLEYLVIDGRSTDNSLEIIKKNTEYINTWISEKDKGVFDAMNKGVALATGEYILFMNAGDWFLTNDIITRVFTIEESKKADLVYGHHEVHYPSFIKKKQALPLHYLWKHMIFSHQSLFCKRSLLLAKPFDLSFSIAADFHFIFNCYREGKRFYNTDIYIAGYLAGGQSEVHVIKAYQENMRTIFSHQPTIKIRLFHYWLILKQIPLVILRKLLPENMYISLMKWKNDK